MSSMSGSLSFTSADSKRQIQAIIGKNGKTNSEIDSIEAQRKQLLLEKEAFLKEKKKFNSMKRSNKKRSKAKSNKSVKSEKNEKILKEQQKISTEWMKISKERDLLKKEQILAKKEKLKTEQQLKNLKNLHNEWKQESISLMQQIDEKYTKFISNTHQNEEQEERRNSMKTHIENLKNFHESIPSMDQSEQKEEKTEKISVKSEENDTMSSERIRLQRLQKEAKEKVKRAEKTLKDLYRKKQELKKQQILVENDRKKFKRMESEYNQFVKEKQALKREKMGLRAHKNQLMSSADKKSKLMLLEAAKLENEKESISKTKDMLQRKHAALKDQKSSADLSDFADDKRLRKKLIMYTDQIDLLENQNKVLQRKLLKRDKFANDYMNENDDGSAADRKNTKYLISDLRSKVIEYENRNKLLTKLLKRHKNVKDAYHSISDLKMAKKLITKLIINNDELNSRINVLKTQLKRLKDLSKEYDTKLYKEFDDEDTDNEERDKKDFDFEQMQSNEMNQIYESMKGKIAQLLLKNESMEEQLQNAENELLQFKTYANEWDVRGMQKNEARSKALYAKLNVQNEKLSNKLDVVYGKLEFEKAQTMTWQHMIEDKMGNAEDTNDESLLLLGQLREENKKLKMQLNVNNNDEIIKGHKAIAMDVNEQFGNGLFDNLQYILMDADLNNDNMLKLKIKDKNDELYNVVLIKETTTTNDEIVENKESEIKMDDTLKSINFEQKNMVNRMENINEILHGYDDRIERMINMLRLIKKSSKHSNNNNNNNKQNHLPSTIISLSSNNSKINQFLAQDRQNKTLIKFAATNRRNDSLESLDSLYDLSHEDAMAKFGMSVKYKKLAYKQQLACYVYS